MGLIAQYSKLIANKPGLILVIALLFSGIMFYGLTKLEMTDLDYEDILPKGIEVIDAMNIIRNDFGGTESVIIVIKIEPNVAGSNEPKDVRDPRIIQYIDILTQKAGYADYVEDVSSISEIIKQSNGGYIPNSISEIKKFLGNPAVNNYISKDYSMSLIRISLNEEAQSNAEEIEKQLSEIIDKTEKPAGVSVQLAGEIVRDSVMKRLIQPDMSKTSMISLIGIVVVLLLLFRSFKNGLLSLTTILFGAVWALGFTSLIGMGISPATSGVISMIIGIGIDFGIQVIVRFKQELRNNDKRKAMEITMNGVLMPMFITTLAALIGFQAMSLGELKVMAEMGTIMSFGVAFCMLVAITIVPSLLVLLEKDKIKK